MQMLLCILFVGGYPGAHGAGMGGMGGMGGLGNLGSLFQDPELLQAFQVYLQICTCASHIKLFHVVMKFKDEIAILTSLLVNHVQSADLVLGIHLSKEYGWFSVKYSAKQCA